MRSLEYGFYQTRPDQTRPDHCDERETPVKQLSCRVSEVAVALVRVTTKAGLSNREYIADENYKRFAATKALEYIQTLVSSARYSNEKYLTGNLFIKPVDANKALERGIGICGNQIAVFLAVMEELGIKSRAVQFWYEYEPGVRYSHIGAEVYYGKKWHYFDVTWGAYFTDKTGENILSIDEVLADNDRELNVNEMNVWYQQYRNEVGIEGVFSYLYKDADITKDYVGIIHAYSIVNPSGTYTLPLLDIPNYVGDNKVDNNNAGISYLFDVPQGKYQVTVNLIAKAGCAKSHLYINEQEVAFNNNLAILIVDSPKTAEIRGTDDVCYYVLKDIEMTKIN